MDVDEDDLIGQPLDEVPQQDPTEERCMGRRKQSRDGEIVRDDDGTPLFAGYCGSWPGKGTDHVGEGRCSNHGGDAGSGGEREDAGAPEENTNAVTHGAYAECNSYYQNVLNDDLRGFVDDVFEDYLERYRDLHGDPVLGIESELFRISVTHAKDIGLDRWSSEKPEDLDSGHPLVDKETRKKSVSHPDGSSRIIDEERYRESVVQQAQKRLSTDRRQWLKDLGLLEDPESQKADALGELKDTWKASAQGGDS
ncbi:hypothetical protein [Halosimplex pelagicum]|uniref:Uncharacterized protein n=1 Tax=Halosimplex pelagicum TaxID=869886 RepID=A0A7D5TA99_9EURY|nr:hypothetical protein [Halosimplex pelagicum]QLH82474.1 hypothetical protein HZS54_12990 [Halosimplex pelagicum]QLH82530.1 hypothetical protein HZS54_13295 [Halosimplex pelagicum]